MIRKMHQDLEHIIITAEAARLICMMTVSALIASRRKCQAAMRVPAEWIPVPAAHHQNDTESTKQTEVKREGHHD